MNKFQTSRFINNYIANLELNDLLVNEIKKVVAKFKINLKDIGNNEIFDKVLSYHMNDILKTYPEIKDYINKEQFKQKLIKKYCFAFAQDEIASNLNTPVGEQANNLSFSSQDVDYRSAPIVIYRTFADDFSSYEDKFWLGGPGQHHDQFINSNPEVLQHGQDKDGRVFLACLYLYKDDIIYISTNDVTNYSNDQLVKILKEKYPRPIKGIFAVKYSDPNRKDIKETVRLAKKLL